MERALLTRSVRCVRVEIYQPLIYINVVRLYSEICELWRNNGY